MFLLILNFPGELSEQGNLHSKEIWLRTPSREAGSFSTCKIMAWFPYLLLFKFPSEKDIFPSSRIATKECSKLSNAHSDQTKPFRELEDSRKLSVFFQF